MSFLLATGVRLGEALAVLWSQVDFTHGTVEVTCAWTIQCSPTRSVACATQVVCTATSAKPGGVGDLSWVIAHNPRKTTATILVEAGLSARQVADQFGHARISITQDVYLGRRLADRHAADALERALRDPDDENHG